MTYVFSSQDTTISALLSRCRFCSDVLPKGSPKKQLHVAKGHLSCVYERAELALSCQSLAKLPGASTVTHTNCMLQWEIYDAYIKDQEKQRAQEEANKQKAAAKKAIASAETAETSQDPVKACLLLFTCCAPLTLLDQTACTWDFSTE